MNWPSNAPSEEGWSVEELEAQLQEISREIVIIPGEQMPDHEADFIILWSHSAPRSEVGSDPFGSRIDAVLKAMNPPKIHGLKINMSRTDDGEKPATPDISCYLAPFHNPAFCVLLLATALQEEYFPVQNGPNRP